MTHVPSLPTVPSQKLTAANEIWSNLTAATVGDRDYTASIETARRHALENNAKHLEAAQMLEKKMNTRERWRPGCLEWEAAATKVVMRRYQRCIDILEGLVVARMFELTKMNMSQTGTF